MQGMISATLLSVCLVLAAGSVRAAELLMVEEPDCVYCARFNREIAPAYPKTSEGQRAPLRRLQLADEWPEALQNIPRARYTPTFILIEGGQEVDRLVGYPGDEHFWFLLGQMLEKL